MRKRAILAAACAGLVGAGSSRACDLHAIGDFTLNLTGAHGTSTNTNINNTVSALLADVQSVQYTSTDSYIRSTGIPSHNVGPFPGNPNTPANQNFLFHVPLTPTVNNSTKTATSLGAIGFMVNGVVFFNASDGHTYNNQGFWTQNANVVEASSFDSGMGHPQQTGVYHYHQQPALLRQQLDDDGTHHSPLLGFAFDGFPVYGPYGYASTNGTGGVKRMVSSYQLRNMTTRTTKPDGTALAANQYGPAVSTTYPLGYYLEDYGYVASSGDLDAYNGRFSITPEFPQGTYAYYTTLDSLGKAAYPYIVGPSYYGQLLNENRTQTVSVPAGAGTFNAALSANWSNAADGTWCVGSNWSGGASPMGVGCTANFTDNGTATVHVGVEYPTRIGTINFYTSTSHTISGTSALTLLATSGAGINVLSGNQVISAPVILAASGTFNVSDGCSLELTSFQQTAASINKNSSGTLKLGSLSGAALNVNGGTVQLTSSMSTAAKISSLSVGSAALDLTNNSLVIDYTGTSPGTARTNLINGCAGGSWNGTGINSSIATSIAADNANSHKTAIGYAEASTLGITTFRGVSVDTTAILLRYTYTGDANLDGMVNAMDFGALAGNFGSATGKIWIQGDFNYDGVVNSLDFAALASNFDLSMPTSADASALASFVPEPSLLACAFLALLGAKRNRIARPIN